MTQEVRNCKNCGFSMYSNIRKTYVCLNPNPMIDDVDATFPVSPDGICSWHRFRREMFDD